MVNTAQGVTISVTMSVCLSRAKCSREVNLYLSRSESTQRALRLHSREHSKEDPESIQRVLKRESREHPESNQSINIRVI